MKVTSGEIIRTLVSRGVFEFKKDAEYQIGIKDEQIVVNKFGSPEIAYLGNTLESVIKLRRMFKQQGTEEQQDQINKALMDLMSLEKEEEWQWKRRQIGYLLLSARK